MTLGLSVLYCVVSRVCNGRNRSTFEDQHLGWSHRRLETESQRKLPPEDYSRAIEDHLEMFKVAPETQVIGPSSFPKPSDKAKSGPDDDVIVALKPALGKHRPDQDAVVVFAAEYPINVYVQFIESLRSTGYTGDIVLSIHEDDLRSQEIKEYLDYYADGRGLIVYTPRQVCYTREGAEVESANGGSRTCKLHEVYGRMSEEGTLQKMEDPRGARTLQNIRYEIYWAMLAPYKPNSWVLLVDARDTIFQANPFQTVPRNTDPTITSGILYFFGESVEATNIGISAQYNYRWIRIAYGLEVANAVKEKPIICSGATMGEVIAIETYLRAMVAEADETGTVIMGSDQGFHNRLHYSNKLANADRIHAIVVFDQGTGIVNNMAALRSKSLDEWGNGQIVTRLPDGGFEVKNWDGSISPVVHQFDRHKELARYFSRTKGKRDYSQWKSIALKAKHDAVEND